jgi:hypothetical protein
VRHLSADRVVVVVTKADIIDENYIVPGRERQKVRLKQLRQMLEGVEDELEHELEDEREDGGGEYRKLEVYRLRCEVKAAEKTLKAAEDGEKCHCIQMRSERTKQILQGRLGRPQTTPPRVLSIANAAYATHVAGFDPSKAPALSIEQTNIPALRRMVANFPNEM